MTDRQSNAGATGATGRSTAEQDAELTNAAAKTNEKFIVSLTKSCYLLRQKNIIVQMHHLQVV